MLKLLTISNLAVISHLQVEFEPGFNVLSGETGAGKSIILAALRLLLGERASQDLLRTGETRAYVEGVFDVTDNAPLLQILAGAGIDPSDDDLLIKREIGAATRGKVFVNNQSATVNLLRQIQPHLIDVHGQGDQQSLILTPVQTSLLDGYAHAETAVNAVGAAFGAFAEAVESLDNLRKGEAERLQHLDLIEFQISEIERVNPAPDEDTGLGQERLLLANAEKLAALCSDIGKILYDEDDAAVSRIAHAERRLGELAGLDPAFKAQHEQLANARYLVEDVAMVVRGYGQGITFSEARLQVIEERLVLLERLRRKYGKTLAEIVTMGEQLKISRAALSNTDVEEKNLTAKTRKLALEYSAAAAELSAIRRQAAGELERKLKKDLAEVALEKAVFRVHFNSSSSNVADDGVRQILEPASRALSFNRMGEEQVEFHFSANQGEEARALAAVASGGELSRLMLLLKSNIAPTPYPRTLVFDEIDTGIGGRVADAVGQRLRKLARANQVVCVTHQAQIARYADCHLFVDKTRQGKRTVTTVSSLDHQARIRELARMMAGDSITDLTLRHAEEFLAGSAVAAGESTS